MILQVVEYQSHNALKSDENRTICELKYLDFTQKHT